MTPAAKLDLIRSSYSAFSPPDLDALLRLYHRECEWRMGWIAAATGTDVYREHSGLRDFVDVIAEAAASHVTELDQVRIRDDAVVLIEFTNRVRTGGATGMELTLQGWQEIDFRDGLILTVTQHEVPPPGWDEAAALA
jgi:ketosteroid isomerase-like protein